MLKLTGSTSCLGPASNTSSGMCCRVAYSHSYKEPQIRFACQNAACQDEDAAQEPILSTHIVVKNCDYTLTSSSRAGQRHCTDPVDVLYLKLQWRLPAHLKQPRD